MNPPIPTSTLRSRCSPTVVVSSGGGAGRAGMAVLPSTPSSSPTVWRSATPSAGLPTTTHTSNHSLDRHGRSRARSASRHPRSSSTLPAVRSCSGLVRVAEYENGSTTAASATKCSQRTVLVPIPAGDSCRYRRASPPDGQQRCIPRSIRRVRLPTSKRASSSRPRADASMTTRPVAGHRTRAYQPGCQNEQGRTDCRVLRRRRCRPNRIAETHGTAPRTEEPRRRVGPADQSRPHRLGPSAARQLRSFARDAHIDRQSRNWRPANSGAYRSSALDRDPMPNQGKSSTRSG